MPDESVASLVLSRRMNAADFAVRTVECPAGPAIMEMLCAAGLPPWLPASPSSRPAEFRPQVHSHMTGHRVGLWLVGAFGGVGTTITLGLAAMARGLADRTGLVTELPVFAGLPLA